MSGYYPNARRPKGLVPVWATVELMVDPGEDWDGTVTKIRPSSGLIAAGWLPTEQPPAERLNWQANDITRRLAALDMIEARTYPEPAPGVGGTTAGVGNAVGQFSGARWQAVETIFHATNSTKVQKSIDGGFSWADTLTVASATFSGIATRETSLKAGATCASYSLTGAAKVALTGGDAATNNAWASTTLAGTGSANTAQCVVADPFVADVFLVGGNDLITAINTPVVWRVVAPLGAFSAQSTVLMGSNPGAPVRIVCAGPTYKVGVAWSGSVNRVWRWQDGDAIASAVTTPTTAEIVDLLWLPEDELYLLIADSGSGVELWTSTTGGTGSWTQLDPVASSGTALFDAGVGLLRGACVRGSIILIPLAVAGVVHIMVSGDAGVTWEAIGDPVARQGAATERIADLGNRFMCAGYKAAAEVVHALSLRAG